MPRCEANADKTLRFAFFVLFNRDLALETLFKLAIAV
jgi:hypothetical protein